MNRSISRAVLIVAGLLVALFAYRAVWGWVGGVAYVRGKYRVEHGRYVEALPALERGAIGGKKATALWLRGLAHFGVWQERVAARESEEAIHAELIAAHQDFLEAATLSPASGWYWTELAQLYHMWDGLQRFEQGNLLSLVGRGPWAYVGHQGRVAIGLARLGIEREPNYYAFHDKLAIMLLNYELEEEAAVVMRESAHVQPLWANHDYGSPRFMTPTLLDAFAQGAREALGNAPMINRAEHLIALGRIEFIRENYAQAEEDLKAALELGGHSLNRADTQHHLGMTVARQGRYDEALEYLEQAKSHERILPLATLAEARTLVEADRVDEGLQALRRLRQLKPGNVDYALEFAYIAAQQERYPEAIEALRSAITVQQDDARSYRQLIAVHLMAEDVPAARETLDLMERRTGQRPAQVQRLIDQTDDELSRP